MTWAAASPAAVLAHRTGPWKAALAIALAVAIAAAVLMLRDRANRADALPVLAGVGGDFELAGAAGARVRLHDLRGRVVLLFFGYTHCPDVCPTTLLALKQARERLGSSAAGAQVVMISVDPQRDPPDQLAQYVRFFDPSFIGLSGTPDEIDQVAAQYHVFHRRRETASPAQYSVSHSGHIYALDRSGRVRALLGAAATPAEISDAMRQLLHEPARPAS